MAPSLGTFIQEGVLIPGLFTICPQNSALSFCPLPEFFMKKSTMSFDGVLNS